MKKVTDIRKIVSGTGISSRRVQYLEKIYKFGDNLEPIPGTDEHPPHLIAHGIVRCGEEVEEVRTAINVRLGPKKLSDAIEFSTNVGQVPDTPLGSATVNRLNHRLDGKFVTFDSGQAGRADVVYASRRPADWLGRRRTLDELEHHAKIQVIAKPILETTFKYEQPDPDVPYQDIKNAAREIVDASLDLHHRLRDKLASSPLRYFFKPPRSLGE